MSVTDYERYIPPLIRVTRAHRQLQPIGRMRHGAFVSIVGTRVFVLTSTQQGTQRDPRGSRRVLGWYSRGAQVVVNGHGARYSHLSRGQRDIVLVHLARLAERLCDPLAQCPQRCRLHVRTSANT